MKRFLSILSTLLISAVAFAQGQLVTWSSSVEKADGDVYKVIFTGKIADGYHTYTLTDEFSATELMDPVVTGGELVGEPYELSTPTEETDEFGDLARHYYNEIIIAQDVKAEGGAIIFALVVGYTGIPCLKAFPARNDHHIRHSIAIRKIRNSLFSRTPKGVHCNGKVGYFVDVFHKISHRLKRAIRQCWNRQIGWKEWFPR